MRRRKALPLYDRRWVLLTEAHAEHAKRIVSGVRAAREYIEHSCAMGASAPCFNAITRSGTTGRRRRCELAVRALLGGLRTSVFWQRAVAHIFSRADKPERAELRLGPAAQWLLTFVWGPDLKKFFGWDTALTKQQQQMTEVPMKSGRTPVHDYAELAAVAMVLILRKSKTNQAPIVKGLRKWCGDNEKKVPPESTLKDIANTALRVAERLK